MNPYTCDLRDSNLNPPSTQTVRSRSQLFQRRCAASRARSASAVKSLDLKPLALSRYTLMHKNQVVHEPGLAIRSVSSWRLERE